MSFGLVFKRCDLGNASQSSSLSLSGVTDVAGNIGKGAKDKSDSAHEIRAEVTRGEGDMGVGEGSQLHSDGW